MKGWTDMKITVAGEAREVKDGLTVTELIEQENVENPEYISVSVNDEFVSSGRLFTRPMMWESRKYSPQRRP